MNLSAKSQCPQWPYLQKCSLILFPQNSMTFWVVVFRPSQLLVKVQERWRSWFNTGKVCSDLRHQTRLLSKHHTETMMLAKPSLMVPQHWHGQSGLITDTFHTCAQQKMLTSWQKGEEEDLLCSLYSAEKNEQNHQKETVCDQGWWVLYIDTVHECRHPADPHSHQIQEMV